jgi:hypothetical protein
VPESRAGVALVYSASSVYLASCTSANPSTQSSPSLTTSVIMIILIALSISAAAIERIEASYLSSVSFRHRLRLSPKVYGASGRRSTRRHQVHPNQTALTFLLVSILRVRLKDRFADLYLRPPATTAMMPARRSSKEADKVTFCGDAGEDERGEVKVNFNA